jgi:trans-aconitate 2-methyltransferase
MTASFPSWDPKKYLQFEAERTRAWHDLVARLGDLAPETVVDLGCGPGHLTATLADRWPDSLITGVDSSPEMIAAAQPTTRTGHLTYEQATIEGWKPERPVDLLIANAALHWVPTHMELLAQWTKDAVAAGGTIAFQMPAINNDVASQVMHEVTTSPRWSERLHDVAAAMATRRSKVRPPEEYTEALVELGCAVDAWQTTYVYLLPGDDPVLDFLLGTGLRPYLDALGENERPELCADMGVALRHTFPRKPYGTLMPFSRVFVVARLNKS